MRLTMDMGEQFDQYPSRSPRFLTDTETGINLIRTGTTGPKYLSTVIYHLQITTANQSGVEGILCYEWLARYDLVVRRFKNCVQKEDDISGHGSFSMG